MHWSARWSINHFIVNILFGIVFTISKEEKIKATKEMAFFKNGVSHGIYFIENNIVKLIVDNSPVAI